MKTVLLPTDFSSNAGHAINYAARLFSGENINFILVNTYEPPRPTGMLINVDDIVKKESVSELTKHQHKFERELANGDSTVISIAQRGDLSEALEITVKQKNADLIIMGTKGASGLKQILMGSNTAKVIRASMAPVLAIPEEANLGAPSKIVFAADYEHLNDFESLHLLREIARISRANILIVNVTTDAKGKSKFNPVIEKLALNDYFKDIPHSYHFIESKTVEKGLNDFIVENKADMLATIPGRNNFFDSIFHKSVTNKMVMHSRIPLLALKA